MSPTFILNQYSSSEEESDQVAVEEEPDDPTVVFDEYPSPAVQLVPELVETCFDRLRQENLLVLTCFDSTVLLTASCLIASRFSGSKRFLSLELGDDQEVTLDTLLHEKLPWTSPTLIVADATSFGGQRFVDSVARSQSTAIVARSRFRDQQRLLLLLTTPEMVSPSEYLPSVSVPFLEPRLNALFPDQAKEWAGEIESQRQARQWGDNEKRFWELFDDYRRRGSLEQAIDKRRGASGRTGLAGAGPGGPKITSGAELENTVLFLAAFFPSLPVEDFQNLLLRYLEDRVKKVTKTTFILTEEGEKLPQEVEEERRLADLWLEGYERIYQHCQLKVLPPTEETAFGSSRSGTRGPVVDFELPELRDHVRGQFLGLHYLKLVQLVAQVREQRLLFEPSPSVMTGTLQLMETMAAIDSHRYGTTMLLELLDSQESASESQAGIDRALMLSRLYLLIRAFLKKPALAPVIDRFINELIGKGRHADALELVKRLRFAPEFDQVVWWKQLLDRGNNDAKEKTFKEMTAALQAGGSQLSETLRKVGSWLPKRGELSSRQSAERANQLLFELLEGPIRRSRFRRNGVWPLEEPLQMALCEVRTEGEGLSPVEWLFHPSFSAYLQKNLPHYLNLVVWTWSLHPVVRHLQVEDAQSLGKRWYFDLYKLPSKAGVTEESLTCLPAFQALVLADLALGLDGVEHPADSAEAAEPLAQVVAAAAASLVGQEQRLLLRGYWGAMRQLIQELAKVGRAAGVPLEEFERARSRLKAQHRSLGSLLTLFRQEISTEPQR